MNCFEKWCSIIGTELKFVCRSKKHKLSSKLVKLVIESYISYCYLFQVKLLREREREREISGTPNSPMFLLDHQLLI
jgi:hypothetical protein